MKRIVPMEIKFYGPTLHIMTEHISENAWSESLGVMIVDNEVPNFDQRIRARIIQFDKKMHPL